MLNSGGSVLIPERFRIKPNSLSDWETPRDCGLMPPRFACMRTALVAGMKQRRGAEREGTRRKQKEDKREKREGRAGSSERGNGGR